MVVVLEKLWWNLPVSVLKCCWYPHILLLVIFKTRKTPIYMLIQWLNAGVLTQLFLCLTDSCVQNFKNDPGFAGTCKNKQAFRLWRERQACSEHWAALWHSSCNSCSAHPSTTTQTHPYYYRHYQEPGWRNRCPNLLPAGVARDWRSPVRLRYHLEASLRLWES